MQKISCVYKIENKINQEVYIGETSNFYKRVSDHRSELNRGFHENPNIDIDIKRFNANDFVIEILEKLPNDKQVRLDRETYYINLYGGIESDNVYNYKDKNSYNQELLNHMSCGRKDIAPWNKGIKDTKHRGKNSPMFKYDKVFVEQLRQVYAQLGSYGKVAKYFDMQKGTVHRLITRGSTE